jgi:hypothetical protein
MTRKQEEERLTEQKRQEDCQLAEVVRDNVMKGLGRPAGLHRVQVSSLWHSYYRVNVFVGPDFATSKVVHSFFLETDGTGKILSSSPAITRAY